MSEQKSLLQKLKELFSLSRLSRPAADSESIPEEGSTITVEREPDTASEDAVKGTDTAEEPGEDTDELEDDGEPETRTEDGAEEKADEEAVETDEGSAPPPEGGSDEPVDEITGIGPTYAERLGEAGISTVGDLAAADAETVADAAQASENKASDWIERAKNFE